MNLLRIESVTYENCIKLEVKKQFRIFRSLYKRLTTTETRKYYSQWQWIGYEYLVKIVLLGLLTEAERKKQIAYELSWGFKGIQKMYEIYHKLQKVSLGNSLMMTMQVLKELGRPVR